MRGEKEKKCLDFVKANIKSENYYAFTQDDIDEFKGCFNSAVSNPNSNEFPDFICDNGFIEHFQITSGKITRKGSEHIKELSQYKNQIKKDINQEITDNPNEIIEPYHYVFHYPKHSYEYLKKSIEENWEKHIESLDNYTGNKNIGIFMIEYQDSTIEMIENIFVDWKEGLSCGNLRRPQELDYYSLCRDKEILEFIYKYKNKINYVIYVFSKGLEIIKLNNILEINKLFPWNFHIVALHNTIRVDHYIPLPRFQEDN
ncbi:MAG: hypothetical protein J1E36_02200 [Eubacterium sp.]|nr:hypothetical protein [Eubacterium sp.]